MMKLNDNIIKQTEGGNSDYFYFNWKQGLCWFPVVLFKK